VKKGVIIAIAAVLVVLIAGGIFLLVKTSAPNFEVDGTYICDTDENSTVIINGDAIKYNDSKGTLKLKGRSFEYLFNNNDAQVIIYEMKLDDKSDKLAIHSEDGKVFLSMDDKQFTLSK